MKNQPSFLPLWVLAALSLTSAALAGAPCVEHPKSEWIPEAEFQKRLVEQGYSIKKFKVAGHCYEIYGKDKSGNRVETYFDTKTGDVVKSVSR